MFGAWMDRAQQLRKNDIFDMLFVGCGAYVNGKRSRCVLEDKRTYLISFDKTVKKFISEKMKYNGKRINEFYL